MKLHYLQKKLFKITLWITVSLFLVSCGTYQSVYYNDGIYGDSSARTTEKKISVVNEKEFDSYEENYFSKTLDKLGNIENNEIFTDVDNYDANDPEFSEDYVNYNSAQPWGYEDNDVIVVDNNQRGLNKRLDKIMNKITLSNFDIRDEQPLVNASKGVDCIIHAAYVNGTETFYKKPKEIVDIAIKGMLNVLKACEVNDIRELILLSSS